jgi:hypothetical protein
MSGGSGRLRATEGCFPLSRVHSGLLNTSDSEAIVTAATPFSDTVAGVMAEQLSHLLAQSFTLTGTLTGTATDQAGVGRTVTFNTGTKIYRIYLANIAAGTGASATPLEFLSAMETAMGTHWTVTLRTNGLVRVTYTGTGTGTMNFHATVAALLGHSGTVGPLATNAYTDGSYQPTHCVFAINFADDTGWILGKPRTATAMLPNGKVYGFTDRSVQTQRRGFSISHAPRDSSHKIALTTSNPTDPPLGTVAYAPSARVADSWTGEPAQSAPWSIQDTMQIALDQTVGIAWGNLPDIIANTSGANKFDVVQLTPECLQNRQLQLWTPGNDSRRDAMGFEVVLQSGGLENVRA